MKKKKIIWYKKSKVIYNNNILFSIGSTKNVLNVEIWAGNHSFYTKLKKDSDISGRIKKFFQRTNLIN